jgi:hypothetical protein
LALVLVIVKVAAVVVVLRRFASARRFDVTTFGSAAGNRKTCSDGFGFATTFRGVVLAGRDENGWDFLHDFGEVDLFGIS